MNAQQRQKMALLITDACIDAVRVALPGLLRAEVARVLPELRRLLTDERLDDDEPDNAAALARAERAIAEAGARERANPPPPPRVQIEHALRRAHLDALKRGGSR